MKRIYLDNAATTKLNNKVKEKMIEVMDFFANPSSQYNEAFEAQHLLRLARERVAKVLCCEENEIIFTGSGTESDNLAIIGVARALKNSGKHIITTTIEHPAVLKTMEFLESEGFEVSYLNVNSEGLINIEDLKFCLRDDTILVSIMYANNEIGTIQPIQEISEILQNHKALFHTDACQAMNYLDNNVKTLKVDLLTFSGSKIYGPKGVGVLYKKNSVIIEPIIFGGGQESNLRSGTENIFLITGLVEALEITENLKNSENERIIILQNYFINELIKHIPEVTINGSNTERLVNNVHISIYGIEGEAVTLMLDQVGIAAATGSACSSKDLDISHVLRAIKLSDECAHGSLRFSLGRETTKNDIDYVIKELTKITERLRSFSAITL